MQTCEYDESEMLMEDTGENNNYQEQHSELMYNSMEGEALEECRS